MNENFEAADQEIKRLQDKNMQDFEEMDLKQKEEIRKFQKYLEEKTGVIHSLEKKMQKFEDVHSRVLNEFEIKKDELSETLGVNNFKKTIYFLFLLLQLVYRF